MKSIHCDKMYAHKNIKCINPFIRVIINDQCCIIYHTLNM